MELKPTLNDNISSENGKMDHVTTKFDQKIHRLF